MPQYLDSTNRPKVPQGPSTNPTQALLRLDKLLDNLLDPKEGCPWDREQTTNSLYGNILEEVYELLEAISLNQPDDILEEAGDVLFLIIFLGRLTSLRWNFGLTEMLDGAVEKMILRHPHVFGSQNKDLDVETIKNQWQAIKRKAKPQTGVLDSVPLNLPALVRCHRLASKAGRAGFDWPDAKSIRTTLNDELSELDAELTKNPEDSKTKIAIKHEIGDLLATVVNLSRRLGFSAEEALSDYNHRFTSRFKYMEETLATRGLKPEEVDRAELENLWQEAKQKLQKS